MGTAPTNSARWLRWDREHRELFDADYCRTPSDRHTYHPGEPALCQLPHRHDGPHDFDYTPNRKWPFPEEVATSRPVRRMKSLDDAQERDRAETHHDVSGDGSGAGSQVRADKGKSRARRPPPPLEVTVDVTYVKCDSLAQAQFEAIKAVLEWARDQQKRDKRNSAGDARDG